MKWPALGIRQTHATWRVNLPLHRRERLDHWCRGQRSMRHCSRLRDPGVGVESHSFQRTRIQRARGQQKN